jgi:tetratricopeptide (TPR) repeat protein
MVINMSKLILCSGVRAQRPYCFTSGGIRIYSIEELCYYLYNHIYLIDEITLNEELFDWINSELNLPDRADKLKQLKKQKADLKTIITVILCSADYYTENEIKGILKLLDDILKMPLVKRRCLKAAELLKNDNYKEAAEEYEIIIHSKEAVDLTPEEYGDIYHNLAVAKTHITGMKEASHLFLEAYERNHRDVSLQQYLYSLLLMGDFTEFQKKIEQFQVSESLQKSVSEFVRLKEEEAIMTDSYKLVEQLSNQKENTQLDDFFNNARIMIDTWKAQYSKT